MKQIDLTGKRIIISRTDSIGDVMLTLPICAWIKEKFPTATILFLGKGYTKPIVEAYQKVDEYLDWLHFEKMTSSDQIEAFKKLNADVILHVFPNKTIARLAKKAGVQDRIGTSHRLFHLTTCNHRLDFTRKRSELHESQLNHELLRLFGLTEIPSLEKIVETTEFFNIPEVELPTEIQNALNSAQKTIILHPKSQGSAREWPMKSYLELTELLLNEGYTIFYTGTDGEGQKFRDQLPENERLIDTTGKMSLDQLIKLISGVNALVACSTGPLHISGYTGIKTIGLFSPRRPIHPGRWKALGKGVQTLVFDEFCPTCAQGKDCDCIEKIEPKKVLETLKNGDIQ